MMYMVVEHFKEGAVREIYRRFEQKGRMMPKGLDYVSSWISEDWRTCWQVMETDDPGLFQQWTMHWDDLMDFDIVAVRTSAEMRSMMADE